jgi:Putative MetA-pathway of phenol degradation
MRTTGMLPAVAALFAWSGAALAGPPYATDDPEPAEPGHWEIYAFASGTGADHGFDGEAGLDINYGLAPDLQLTVALPVGVVRDSGSTHAGAGNLEAGVKYRIFEDEAAGLQVSIFPQVELPTAGRRFGTGRVRLLLPVWAQKDVGPWSLFGGGGYAINPGAGNRNFWEGGLALTRSVTPRLSLGAEIFHEEADAADAHAVTSLGVGGSYRLGGPFSLLASAGPAFEHHGGTGVNAYLALGLSFWAGAPPGALIAPVPRPAARRRDAACPASSGTPAASPGRRAHCRS